MGYQKETTHICESSSLAKEYRLVDGVWFYFYGGVWHISDNGIEWNDKNLTPIVNAESQSATEQEPNGIGQHDNGAKLDAGKPMAGRLLGMFGNALAKLELYLREKKQAK